MASPGTWRRALVTGASAGIGRAFAERLAAAGSDLVVVARRRQVLEDVATDLEDRHGVSVEVLAADLTDPGQLSRIEARAADTERPPDLLVNNAGAGTSGPFHRGTSTDSRAVFALNALTPLRLTHAVLPGMVGRGHGGVLNVSSMAGFHPVPYSAVYAASKAFLTSLTRAVREEVAGTGVAVTALCPGFVRTAMIAEAADRIPGPLLLDTEKVVTAALAGLARNRGVVVPGAPYRIWAATGRLVPRTAVRRGLGWAIRRG